jgi:hypothetical protein
MPDQGPRINIRRDFPDKKNGKEKFIARLCASIPVHHHRTTEQTETIFSPPMRTP